MDQYFVFIKTLKFTTGDSVLEVSYLIASVLFISGLKMLSHPESARKGNIWAAIGMGMAIVSTILFHKKDGEPIGNVGLILLAIIIGTVIGLVIAKKVRMTAMPQLVSLFNGMGGAAAALISISEFPHINAALIERSGMANGHVLAILLGLIIGSVSFAGSQAQVYEIH
jgi:NAD(P) transhydrogenase subunit beta